MNGYCVKINLLGTNEQVLRKYKPFQVQMNRYCVKIKFLGTNE